MMAKRVAPAAPESPQVRCGIYTRKSSEDGLQLEFNSLDAQREAAEAYVASQRHEGWVCLPERYDDGGDGGNPATAIRRSPSFPREPTAPEH